MPSSPFPQITISEDDSFRSMHLTPPPSSLKFTRPLSPLNDTAVAVGKGLEQDRFQALLKTSRSVGLRKELALKTHKTKQLERRALFLSKILAPPSPTATLMPKTPPESPAIFHYSLPSPGLESPLALFESLSEDSNSIPLSRWVEQVDFKIRAKVLAPRVNTRSSSKPLPSLDQITARLGYASPISAASTESRSSLRRLPAFLKTAVPTEQSMNAPTTPSRPQLPIGTLGRLRMPIRAPKPAALVLPPHSPCSPLTPNIQITTTLVPQSATTSPTELSETNLIALESASRQRKAQEMLSALRRRTGSDSGRNVTHTNNKVEGWEKRSIKRRSAPSELLSRGQSTFDHPVLALPGAF